MNKEVEDFLTELDEKQFDALIEIIEEVITEDIWENIWEENDDNSAA